MRIALFHNLPSGGAKRAVYEWVKRLVSKHSIDVYTLSTADHEYCDIRPFIDGHNIFDFSTYPLFKSPMGRLNQFQRWRDLKNLDSLYQKIADRINQVGYDLLFAHTCRYTVIPALLKYIQIPSIYYLHEPFGPGFTRNFSRQYSQNNHLRTIFDQLDPLIRLYQRELFSTQIQSLQKTKKVLANSHFTRQHVKASYGVDSTFCPLGVDIESFYPIHGSRLQDDVISVGEMSPRKGFDFIIESLGQIPKEQRPSLKLACNMVDNNEMNYVKSLAEQYSVNLTVLTNLNSENLCALYNSARLCVYAPVMEPFGLVPLEAMACEIPVVGVREGGVQESVIHGFNGLLVERNPVKFGAAIHSLLSNPSLLEKYGRNGRDYVMREWTWEKSVSTLTDYLLRCIEN